MKGDLVIAKLVLFELDCLVNLASNHFVLLDRFLFFVLMRRSERRISDSQGIAISKLD